MSSMQGRKGRKSSSNPEPEKCASNNHGTCISQFDQYLYSLLDCNDFLRSSDDANSKYLRFRNFALLKSIQMLIHLKCTSSLESEKEKKILTKMLSEDNYYCDAEERQGLQHAMQLFKRGLPQFIKKLMLRGGFQESDTDVTCEQFIIFLGRIILVEVEKNFQLKQEIENSEPDETDEETLLISNGIISSNNMSIKNYPFDTLFHISDLLPIARTKKHVVYLVSPENIALKVLKSDCPPTADLKNLEYEYKIAKICSHPSLRFCLAKTIQNGRQGLLLEWFDGYPIDVKYNLKNIKMKQLLEVARETVSVLLAMHSKCIMHLNLSCAHILLSSNSNSVKIIGTGSSTSFKSEKRNNSYQDLLEKDLHYISPEQTGRVQREVDYRSDFYSLGIVLYKVLAGKYPIDAMNASEMINLHVAHNPLPLHSIDSNIPVPVSDMISKLLQKNPEDRYKSAQGIIFDLDLIISELSVNSPLRSITLSQHDNSETFLLPQKLYGRSVELKKLCAIFDRISHDSFEVVFITGGSGSGKSSLVTELYKTNAHRGFFAFGKYDYASSEPYSGFEACLTSFCNDLLLKDEVTVAKYKSRIIGAIGDEGILLTNVIENLHMIIGDQPDISDCIGQEAKNRFNYVLSNFIKAICAVGAPIVIVLDDLQWLDSASYDVIFMLVADTSIKNLILIGTYREVIGDNDNMANALLEIVKKKNISTTLIEVKNLDEESSNEMISDTVCVCPFESYPLTTMIYKKTNGNPFFIKQMLRSLHKQGSIYFCNDTCSWKWDASILDNSEITESVLELMRQKIQALDSSTQQTLKVASCLGSPFSLLAVKIIVNDKVGIDGALSCGMIARSKENGSLYCFVHDQVQEAALSLLPKNKDIFLYIGLKLWELLPAKDLNGQIFTIANLLLKSVTFARNNQSIKIAEVLMRAGEKALSSAAFLSAFEYLDSGIKLVGPDCWKTHYNLTLRIYNLAVKTAYCTKNDTKMDDFIHQILTNAQCPLDLVEMYSLRIMRHNDMKMFEDAMHAAVSILNKLGEHINLEEFNNELIASKIHVVENLLSSKTDEEIIGMEVLNSDVCVLNAMMIMLNLMTSCYFCKFDAVPIIAARVIELTFRHGLSKYACIGFCAMGNYLSNMRIKLGDRCGKLSLILLKKFKTKELIPHIYSITYGIIFPVFSSVHLTLKPLICATRTSLETGYHVGVIMNATVFSLNAFFSGKVLPQLLQDINDLKELMPMKNSFLAVNQAVLNLQDGSALSSSVLGGEIYDFNSNREATPGTLGPTVVGCMIAYLFQEYSQALKCLDSLRPFLTTTNHVFSYSNFIFYDGLVSVALARCSYCPNAKKKWAQNTLEQIWQLKRLAENSPQNYLNKVYLLEGEYYALRDQELLAEEHYKNAVSASNQHGFPHEEGIACERAGMFYLNSKSQEDKTVASELLLQSYNCYKRWGAQAKMKHLLDLHPFLADKVKGIELANDITGLSINAEESSQNSVSMLTEPCIRPVNKRVRSSTEGCKPICLNTYR